jgi:tRNA nucleotidyltransferase (CCA-adding enzyme)
VPVRFRIADPSLTQPLRQIEHLIRAAGGRTWLTGCCLRDLVLGRQPRKLELEISGLPPGRLYTLLTTRFSVQLVGRAFGLFRLQGLPIDISIPSHVHTDSESAPGLLRQSNHDIDEALARRDFTMNAMAWDPDTLEIRDPFNGRADLDARVLRHVSDRFGEDPMRVLRGMQLVARFGLTVAPETVAICTTPTQDGQPSEQIWEEWKKFLLYGIKPSLGLQFLSDCGWLRFYPELAALQGCKQDPIWHPEGDVWIHTLHCLDWFAGERTGNRDDDLIVGLGILCHDFGKPATTSTDFGRITSRGHESEGEAPARRFLERLACRHELINEVLPLVRCHLRPRALYDANATDSAVRRLARQVKRIDRLVRVARADHAGRPPKPFDGFPAGTWLLERARRLDVENQAPTPLVLGHHLLELGIQSGQDMGQLLDECYEAQLDGLFSSLDEGIVFAQGKLPSLR